MSATNEIPGRSELIWLMAMVYRSVDWRAQGGKSVLDRWSGMVMVASRAETVAEFINNLCKRLGVGAPMTIDGDLIDLLDACAPHDRELLDLVDREAIPLAMLAYDVARGSKRKPEAAQPQMEALV